MNEIDEILSKHPFFSGMSTEHQDAFMEGVKGLSFDDGELLCCEGDEANRFYFIQKGTVALELFAAQRGAVVVQTVGGGDILALPWLTSLSNWHFDARAVEPTSTIFVENDWLNRKCEEDFEFGYDLMKRFAYNTNQRLHAAMLQLLDLYANPLSNVE